MNKIIRIVAVISLILLVTSIPVNAGWFSNILKGIKSSKGVKSVENAAKKNIDDTQKIPRQESKSLKEADDLAKKEIKTQREKLELNVIKGEDWEKAVQKYYAKKATNYFDSIDKIRTNIIYGGSGSLGKINDFTIIGGKNTKYYLNEKIDQYFLKEPDILIVKGDGKINKYYPEKIEIIDAKTSEGAIRIEQESGFLDLCRKAKRVGTECSIKYAEPKSQIEDLWNVACIATIFYTSGGLGGMIADGLCLIPIS